MHVKHYSPEHVRWEKKQINNPYYPPVQIWKQNEQKNWYYSPDQIRGKKTETWVLLIWTDVKKNPE